MGKTIVATEQNPASEPGADLSAAYELHSRIKATGELAATALVEFCKALKEMRDKKLYRALGHSTFEDYTEKALGISRRHAYNYLQILESLGEEFVQSIAQIGIAKLSLLTTVPEEVREEVLQKNDVADMSASALKKALKDAEAARLETVSVRLEKEKLIEQLKAVNAPIDEKEIERRAAELVQAAKSKAAEQVQAEKDKIKKDLEKLEREKNKFKEESEKYRGNAETYKEAFDRLAAEKERNAKEVSRANNPDLLKFKIKIEGVQSEIQSLLALAAKMPEADREKCGNALRALAGSMTAKLAGGTENAG